MRGPCLAQDDRIGSLSRCAYSRYATQLTLQGGPVLLKRSDRGLTGGLGGTEAAVKWRFLDEEKCGFDASMFPRVIFNITQSPFRRGSSRMNFTREMLTLNVGLRREFTETRVLIASLGHELRDPDRSLSLIGYFGVQLIY